MSGSCFTSTLGAAGRVVSNLCNPAFPLVSVGVLLKDINKATSVDAAFSHENSQLQIMSYQSSYYWERKTSGKVFPNIFWEQADCISSFHINPRNGIPLLPPKAPSDRESIAIFTWKKEVGFG